LLRLRTIAAATVVAALAMPGVLVALDGAAGAASSPTGVQFVGASDAGGGNTKVKSLAIPRAAATGNVALLFLASTTTSTWSTPSGVTGWHQVGTYAYSKLRTTVWSKTLAKGDPGSTVRINGSGYSHAAASVVVYSGLSASSPVGATARSGDAATTRHSTPSVTSNGDWIVSYWAGRAQTRQVYTAPKDVKVRVASPDSGSSLTVQSLLADSGAVVKSGQYGGLIAQTSAKTSQGVQWSVALRPAAGVATSPSATPTTSAPSAPASTSAPASSAAASSTPASSTPAPSSSTAPRPATTTTAAPPPPSSTPSPTPTSGTSIGQRSCVTDPRGIPAAGTGGFVGATVSGTQTRSGLESQVGPLRLYRDYYTATQVDYAVSRTKADLAAGVLPWISFKLPYTWPEMAAGKGDAWVTGLVDKLAALKGPVWLAFHHEPENDTATDGSMQAWKAMQQHLAPIVHRRAPNVAYTIVLMAWNTLFGPAEDRLADIWPGAQNVDILGFDLYNEYGAKSGKAQLDYNKYFGAIQTFTSTHGNVPWAIGEVGYTAQAAQNQKDFLQSYYASLLSHGGVGMAYFDSSFNSIADWTLSDPLRISAFREVLGQSLRLC
jgi:hypothetical protein